jgi:pimeloyl-ACP methyl ester carboxylesterase
VRWRADVTAPVRRVDRGAIRVPVKIWHGQKDRFVPVQHGQWPAASVPDAEADISDRDGHLTMIGRIGEIHDWLLHYL